MLVGPVIDDGEDGAPLIVLNAVTEVPHALDAVTVISPVENKLLNET
jgi:hypothetical protein